MSEQIYQKKKTQISRGLDFYLLSIELLLNLLKYDRSLFMQNLYLDTITGFKFWHKMAKPNLLVYWSSDTSVTIHAFSGASLVCHRFHANRCSVHR